jgi:hypothetical protein
MGKQEGMTPITGKVDNLIFYKHPEYGPLVRKKRAGPTKEMVKTGEQFEKVRHNNSEFGRASHYGAIIRNGFTRIIRDCKETKLDTNLSSRLREIMETDKESERGSRDLTRNTLRAFKHFELNSKSLSKQFVKFPIEITMIDGSLEVIIDLAFENTFRGIDAWQVRSTALSVDLVTDKKTGDVQESDIHKLSKAKHTLGFSHFANEQMHIFYGMSVVFYSYDIVTEEYKQRKDIRMNSGFIRYVD